MKSLWSKILAGLAMVSLACLPVATATTSSAQPHNTSLSAAEQYTQELTPDLDCGGSIALVFDVSGSMKENTVKERDAALAMVNTIKGSNITVGAYSFHSYATTLVEPTSVATQEGYDAVVAGLNNLPAKGSGGTSFELAFSEVLNSNFNYDAVLFVTDGQANAGGPSDDALREAGTTIYGVYISLEDGSEIPQSLIDVSSPNSTYLINDLNALAEILMQTLIATCGAEVTVNTEIELPDGTVVNAGAGWTSNTTVDADAPTLATTDADGKFSILIPTLHETERPNAAVNVAELQAPTSGLPAEYANATFQLKPTADGANAACVDLAPAILAAQNGQTIDAANASPVAVTNQGQGFDLNVAAGQVVSCTVTLTAELPAAEPTPSASETPASKTERPATKRPTKLPATGVTK